jgi:hypothetical protein
MLQESLRDTLRQQCLGEAKLSKRERDVIKDPSAHNVGDYLVGLATLSTSQNAILSPIIKKLATKKMSGIDVVEYLGIYDRAFNVVPLRRKLFDEFRKYEDSVGGRGTGTTFVQVSHEVKNMAQRAMKARKNATMKVSYTIMHADRELELVIEFNWKSHRAMIKASSIDPLKKTANKTKLDLKPSL